jgi:hypothetical protein
VKVVDAEPAGLSQLLADCADSPLPCCHRFPVCRI